MLLVTGSEGTSPTPTLYPATAAINTLGGPATIDGSRVTWVGTTTAPDGGMQTGTFTFNGVQSATAGLKTIVIEYVSGEPRAATFSVNGGAPLTVQFGMGGEPGDWVAVGTHVLQVPLKAGSNSILVSNPTGPAPDFVGIDVDP
jgi:alpha-galactosidase